MAANSLAGSMTGLAGNCAIAGPLMSATSPRKKLRERIARPYFGGRAVTSDESILFAGFFYPLLGGDPGLIGFWIAYRELVDLAHELAFQIESQVQDLFTIHVPSILVAQLAHDLVSPHVHHIAGGYIGQLAVESHGDPAIGRFRLDALFQVQDGPFTRIVIDQNLIVDGVGNPDFALVRGHCNAVHRRAMAVEMLIGVGPLGFPHLTR